MMSIPIGNAIWMPRVGTEGQAMILAISVVQTDGLARTGAAA